MNVGVEVDKGVLLFLNLFAVRQDNVYFYNSEKGESIPVEWSKRNSWKRDGYRLIGMGIGLTKNSEGKNEVVYLHQYDAIKYIKEHLEDGQSVFVGGSIEFSHYKRDDGIVVRQHKLIPQKIYLAQEVDFDEEGFEPTANFTQEIVFLGIEKANDNEFWLSSHFVNYNSIEEDVMLVTNPKLAGQLRKS